jgi:hypothetical protein
MSDVEKWRMWLSNRLHLIAAHIHEDFHTWEWTTPTGEIITFSCYWQSTGSWPEAVTDRCSCDSEDLRA